MLEAVSNAIRSGRAATWLTAARVAYHLAAAEMSEKPGIDIDALDLPACCKGQLRTMLTMKEFEPALEVILSISPHVSVVGAPARLHAKETDKRGWESWRLAARAVPVVYLVSILRIASRHADAHPGNDRVTSFWRSLTAELDEIVRGQLEIGSLEDIAKAIGNSE